MATSDISEKKSNKEKKTGNQYVSPKNGEKHQAEQNGIKEKLGKYVSEKFFLTYILAFMVLIPGAEFVTELLGEPYVSQPLIHSLFGYVGIVLVLIWFIVNWGEGKVRPSDIFFWTLVFFAVIALIFTKDMTESTDGYNYEEWLSNFFGYYSLMFAATHIESYAARKKVLFAFIGIAVFESVICVFQSMGMRIIDSFYDSEVHAAENLSFGLAQHQNFYAGLSVLFFGAAAGMMVFYVKKRTFVMIPVVTIILYGSLSTSARISWVGNTTVLLFILISVLIMKKRVEDKKIFYGYIRRFLAVAVIAAVVVAIILITSNKLQSEVAQSFEEFASEDEGRVGNGRFYLWSYAFEALPDNWLTGVGLDNFKWCFTSSPRWTEGQWFNHKAHSEYIHIMSTQGIPALLNYLILLIYAITTAVKNILSRKNKEQETITWIFLAMFAGYAVQAFVNSSVINTAMYFWVTIGMVMPVFSQGKREKKKN